MSRLLRFPTELISRICRFIGRDIDPNTLDVSYENADFNALRLTCRSLYRSTLYDASLRFPLKYLSFKFNYASLAILIRLTRTRYFRDRIRRIHLIRDDSLHRVGNIWDTLKVYLKDEEADTFTRSGDAAFMLAQCLRNLRSTNNFELITYEDGFSDVLGQAVVFKAVEMSKLPESVVCLHIDLEYIREPGWANLSDTLGLNMPLVRDASIVVPVLGGSIIENENLAGFHISNFCLAHPDLRRVFLLIKDVTDLTLMGCNKHPRLRLCHGCEDLFVSHVARTNFTHLSRLELAEIYISGGRFQRFIAAHAATLMSFVVEFVHLTDGSWRSVGLGLSRLNQLSHLNLAGNLYQKHPGPVGPQFQLPPNYKDGEPRAIVYGRSNVLHYLREWAEYFNVYDKDPAEPSRYVQVCLFNIPDVSRSILQQQIILRNYALQFEG